MKNLVHFLAALAVFLALPMSNAQVSSVKVNPNTGALVDPTAATFKSANSIVSGSNGALTNPTITSGTISISLKGLEGSVWTLGPAANDQSLTDVLNIPDRRGISWMNQNGTSGAELYFWSNHQVGLTSGSGEIVWGVPSISYYMNRIQVGGAGSADNDTRFMYLRGASATSSGTIKRSYALSFQPHTWTSGSDAYQDFVMQAVPQDLSGTNSLLNFYPNGIVLSGTNQVTGPITFQVGNNGPIVPNGSSLILNSGTYTDSGSALQRNGVTVGGGITYSALDTSIVISSGSNIGATGTFGNINVTTGTITSGGGAVSRLVSSATTHFITIGSTPTAAIIADTTGTSASLTGARIAMGGGVTSAGLANLFEINIPDPTKTVTNGDFYMDTNRVWYFGRQSSTSGGSTGKVRFQDRLGAVFAEIGGAGTGAYFNMATAIGSSTLPTSGLAVTGSLTTTTVVGIGGTLVLGGSASAPSDAVTPVIWFSAVVGGTNYRVPLYK